MKIYEYTQHKSFDIAPNEVNIQKTREFGNGFTAPDCYVDMGGGKKWRGHLVYLHEASPYFQPMGGVLYVNEKMWKKIAYTPRKSWV